MPHPASVSRTAGVIIPFTKGVQTMCPALRCVEEFVQGCIGGWV